MKAVNYLLIKPDGGYPFGVIAGPSIAGRDELWGPFETRAAAEDHIAGLKAEYSDYEYFTVVKIEVPSAPHVVKIPRVG